MGLYSHINKEIPEETAILGRKLLPKNNVYRIVGDLLGGLINDEDFVKIYERTGGPAISPVLLALVTWFQMLENLTDRQAAEAVRVRLDWKYALHLPLDYAGFSFTNLSHFRARLVEHEEEYLVFDSLIAYLSELGLIQRGGKQRTDSTHILGAVARQSRLKLVWETLRLVLVAMHKEDKEWVKGHIPTAFSSAYETRRSDYKLSQAEIDQEMALAGQDGLWLLRQVAADWPQAFEQVPAVETLRQVWSQQFDLDNRERPGQPRKKPKGGGLIQSPHDPEVRYSEKRGQGWQGYKGQVSETAGEKGTPNFIADIDVTDAQLADARALPDIQQRLEERIGAPEAQYVDRGYVSTDNLAKSHRQGIRLVGPVPIPPTQGLFQVKDFQLDLDNCQAMCPAEQISQSGCLSTRADGTQEYVFTFGRPCQDCPLRSRCTTAKNGRTLRYHVDHVFLEQRHREMQTEEFWRDMRHRPPVEATISQLVHLGARRSRYIGLRKTRLQWIFTAAAVNLRRLALAVSRGFLPGWVST